MEVKKMGCWGMGMTQSDQFMEVYEAFMDEYNEGASVPDITHKILDQYRRNYSKEMSIGKTLFGIHHDDIDFILSIRRRNSLGRLGPLSNS